MLVTIFFLQHYKKVLWNTFIPMITLGFVSKKKITAVQYQYHLNNSLLRHSCERCIGNREISLPIYCYSCHSILYSKITIATESAVQLKACSHMIQPQAYKISYIVICHLHALPSVKISITDSIILKSIQEKVLYFCRNSILIFLAWKVQFKPSE